MIYQIQIDSTKEFIHNYTNLIELYTNLQHITSSFLIQTENDTSFLNILDKFNQIINNITNNTDIHNLIIDNIYSKIFIIINLFYNCF